MKQCEYCGKEISYHELYCSDDCQIKANRFYERSEKFSKPFTVVNTACVFGIPVGLFLMSFLGKLHRSRTYAADFPFADRGHDQKI